MPLVGLAMPSFWVGIMLILVFGLHLGRLFPVGGYGEGFGGHLHSMFLPALTVALRISPILIRSLRASLLERARVRLRHHRAVEGHLASGASSSATRCATRIISTVTVLGMNIAFLVGGTLVSRRCSRCPASAA